MTNRRHIKRCHAPTCGDSPGCAPSRDGPEGHISREDKWRMEYRKHCDDGRADIHDVYWHPGPEMDSVSQLSLMLPNEDTTSISRIYSPSRHSASQQPSAAASAFRVDYTNSALLDRLSAENQRLTRQVDGLQADNQGLRDDNCALRMDRNIARAERDAMRSQRDTLGVQLRHVTTQFADHLARHTSLGVDEEMSRLTNQRIGNPITETNYFTPQAFRGEERQSGRSVGHASPSVNTATAMLHLSAPISTTFDFSAGTMNPTNLTTTAILEDSFIGDGTINPSTLVRPSLQRPQTGVSLGSETDATLVNADDTSWTDTLRSRSKLPLHSNYVSSPGQTLGWGR